MKPIHVGIIPDGNRRWAKSHGIAEYLAHSTPGAYSNLSSIFNTARTEGIKFLSLWAFSTENWDREKRELTELIGVIERGLDNFLLYSSKDRYTFKIIGQRQKFSDRFISKVNELEESTKDYNEIKIILGLSYGGREEILEAVNNAIKKGKSIDEFEFGNYLDTARIPDPDLIIRTGGEKRLSGFMPFQSIYSELIFLDKLFPDFTSQDLIDSIKEYENRKRRFGK